MLALNVFLHLLNIFTVATRLFWLLFAVVEIAWHYTSPMPTIILHGHESLFEHFAPPAPVEIEKPPPIVLFTPIFPLYYLIYSILAPQLLHISAEERSLLLRGSRFMSLAQSIINGTPSPVITKLGVKLPPQERLQYLASLPDMIVTPPEDGDWLPLAGERGGPRVRDSAKGLLAPPPRRGRLGMVVKQAEMKKKRGDKKEDEKTEEEKEKARKKKIWQEERSRFSKELSDRKG